MSHNTYRKQDADFSGLALYYTPKGDYAGGYAYKNGQVVTPTTTTQQTGRQKIQSVSNGNLKPNDMVVECKDWYSQGVIYNSDGSIYEVTTPWQYIGTTCTSYESSGSGGGSTGTGSGGGGGSNGSGSSSTSSPPPPCPPGSTSGVPTASPCVPPPSTVESIGIGKLKVDYMPLPGSSPCSVTTKPVPCFTIITDALKKDFPCAVALIINNLGECGVYSSFVQAFTTAKKPDITWQDVPLEWHSQIPNTTQYYYRLGNTGYNGRSATITLNTSMLQNSSTLLIASAAIHETLHAYINYNIGTATGNFPTNASWFTALDTWATINGLPTNYSDHYQMLTDYFTQAVAALKEWDNSTHTDAQYEMTMLYGLNNATDGTAAQQALLQTEYNKLLTKYGFSTTTLNDYWQSQLTPASAAVKLPTSGCPTN